MTANHQPFMARTIELARQAGAAGEVPIGAVVVCNGEIIAEAANAREASGIATHHAEVMVIDAACKKLGRWRLNDCDLYVTLEPCTMCAGAIVLARFRTVVFGAMDAKAGAVGSLYNVLTDKRLNHQPEVIAGVCAADCGKLLSDFFKARR